MHEELPVGAILDEFRNPAFQQADADQSLRDRAHGGFVRFVPVPARADLRDRSFLGFEHDLVDRALALPVAPADRQRPGDIGGVIVELATGIDQQQFPILHLPAVVAVMQHAGIRAAADDRVIRDVGAPAVELVQDLGHDFVFHAPRCGRLERAPMRGAGDPGRAAHRDDLRAALEQAHLVQRMIECDKFVGRVAALFGL